jgi:V/A-type H+-transporting ATPase subunit A
MDQTLTAADTLGTVPEGIFTHRIMVPFYLTGSYKLTSLVPAGNYKITDTIAELTDSKGNRIPLTMSFSWPVKRPVTCYLERLRPTEPMVTKVRIIDTFLPVARGGTYCIPGPFGAGKTVLQQVTSRHAEIDIVIIAACGERAGEVVETLKEFPELTDPKTGKSLMERTIIICNTSSMPVAAREASVYTAITLAEYYRQMGLHVLLLADSTSRWAQALREMSGRLEEIPGEEAFPAYLESVIASFYERAGLVRLRDNSTGSITIGGTVSPAGGNFDEPVTQSTLKVVGAFHGLSRERSDARKYPAIHPLESWSKYTGLIDVSGTEYARNILFRGNEVNQMMKVVGEEGTSLEDYELYLKGEFIDSVYLQQNSFDPVDASVSTERQKHVFSLLFSVLITTFDFGNKETARTFFNQMRQKFLDYNGSEWMSEDFIRLEKEIRSFIASRQTGMEEAGRKIWEKLN